MTRSTWVHRGLALAAAIVAVVVLGAADVSAVVQKAQTPLDQKTRIYSPFHQFPGGSSLAEARGDDPERRRLAGLPRHRRAAERVHRPGDRPDRRGRRRGIPWIPGLGNSLTLSDIARYMDGPTASPGIPELEKIAREFVDQQRESLPDLRRR